MKLQWRYKSNAAPCRVNHAAVTVGDTIYSFGGYDKSMTSTLQESIDIFVFNTITHKWSELKVKSENAPYKRWGHSVVALEDKIYLWGGVFNDAQDSTLYCFDTKSFTWSKPRVKGVVPKATDGHACCISRNRMYIHGGYDQSSNHFSSNLHCFDFEKSRWSLLPRYGDSPLYRDFHTISAHPDGHILLYGGREMSRPHNITTNPESYPTALHMYNIETMTWSVLSPGMLETVGRRSHSAFVIGCSLWIFGGYNGSEGTHHNDCYSYNFGSDSERGWTKHHFAGPVPEARRRQAICTVNDNTIFLFGGTHPHIEPTNDMIPRVLPMDDFGDMWILDIRPSLRDLCLFQLVNSGQDVPSLFHKQAKCMPNKKDGTPQIQIFVRSVFRQRGRV